MIETQGLGKIYGRGLYALRDLNLTIDKGEFVFLTGPSGAGKSTLLRLLLLQERPSEGDVIVGGRNLSRLTRKKALGWMLRLMHVPAKAAGLGALHHFLVLGFDTFGAMAAHPGGATEFLGTIAQREAGWIQALFDDEPRQVQQKLEQLLPSLSSIQAVRGP